ncbi:hypothetical protein [Actinomadura parmotrematis]|uniref:GTPase domain-containing protein n=1 Tax=Actinomadura parmotrematis TaxID=2864039 RepID=A0ABS7FPB7_9ACTN|nr:hypothetical protein [Actinomadura parmotrematis]MBW8482206.1 hypothetical protein [Actinomadura parmotrematis]
MREKDEATIAVLGAPRSGKTTYQLALLAGMTAVGGRFSLHAHHEDGVDMFGRWQAIVDGGQVDVTDAAPVRRVFTFSRGLVPLTDVRWTDFRGGALDTKGGPGGASDTAELYEELARADCVFVMLSGEHFRRPAGRRPGAELLGETRAHQISRLITMTCTRRHEAALPLPALALLVTKADLVDWEERAVGDVVEELRTLLPVAFGAGTRTAVCRVSAGPLNGTGQGPAQRGSAAPSGVHLPLLFALAEHYRTRAIRLEERLAASALRQEQIGRELAELSPRSRWPRDRRHGDLQQELARIGRERAGDRAWADRHRAERRALLPALKAVAMFQDGRPVASGEQEDG